MGDTPLSPHAAAGRFLEASRLGDTDGALALLRTQPALSRVSLHASAAVCDADAVRQKLAVDPGAAHRRMGPNDLPPIAYAVQSAVRRALDVPLAAQLETLRLLLDAGADPNSTVPVPDVADGIPVLYFPCNANEPAIARLLLERGARVDDGESLYHAAEHDHRECLALLLAFGASLSAVHGTNGNTPLHFLAACRVENPVSASAMRGMAWLLEHGADPNVRSHRSASGATLPGGAETPLIRAAMSGHGVDVMRLLVDHGADVDAARDDGRTAYVMAMRAGHADVAAWLVQAGADRSRMLPVDTLLHHIARADLGAARDVIETHPSVLETLSAEDRRAVVHAVQAGRDDQLDVMLAIGFPVTEEDEWGGTPLHVAAWNGRVELVRRLIDHGAPVNLRDLRYGSSPLGWAAHGSRFGPAVADGAHAAVAALLLEAGATRDAAMNQWNETPESFAHPSVAAVLTRHDGPTVPNTV